MDADSAIACVRIHQRRLTQSFPTAAVLTIATTRFRVIVPLQFSDHREVESTANLG